MQLILHPTVAAFLLALVSCFWITASGQTCKPTSADVSGPFYKKGAPIKRLKTGDITNVCTNSAANDRLLINGTVRRTLSEVPCGVPVKALLDIWHANYNGQYSDKSALSNDFECRAQIVTDASGFYSFATVFPGRYNDNGFRPAHIHYRVTALDESERPLPTVKQLTTQLYFAQDYFLGARDSCQICNSADPTLITKVKHDFDIKTLSGTWDILLQ